MPDSKRFPIEAFEDVLAANASHADAYSGSDLTGRAARGLAIVTCIDSRIDPLAIVGMGPGDVKILRNAGARVTEDVQRTLLLASYLLGVDRILIMPHTDCRMVGSSESDIHATIRAESGFDTRSIEFRTSDDVDVSLALDVVRVRANPLLPPGTRVGGAVYDVHTGRLRPIEV
ncbi:MAG: beta-class carbonic anhydrase [Candidatus Nanopelagicales bacterium]|jgi:carbonic anhydrase